MANSPSPRERARTQALFAAFTSKLDSLLAPHFTAVPPLRGRLRLGQGEWFARQQFVAEDLQSLAVLIPVNRAEAQHSAAITEPPGA